MTITSDQKTGVTPETDKRTALIASLRSLANLFEDIPELPVIIRWEISWNVLGADADALPVIEALVAALSSEAVTHEVTHDPSHAIGVNIPLVGAYKARVVHVYERSMADYHARSSYEPVIQVDVEQDGAA